jgi:BolA protein
MRHGVITAVMTDVQMPSRTDRIRTTLTEAFSPSFLSVRDDSASHAGHAGAHPGGETHFSVIMISAAFQGLSRVGRSRAVHAALASEFGDAASGAMHALALTLRTPAEHASITGA